LDPKVKKLVVKVTQFSNMLPVSVYAVDWTAYSAKVLKEEN